MAIRFPNLIFYKVQILRTEKILSTVQNDIRLNNFLVLLFFFMDTIRAFPSFVIWGVSTRLLKSARLTNGCTEWFCHIKIIDMNNIVWVTSLKIVSV